MKKTTYFRGIVLFIVVISATASCQLSHGTPDTLQKEYFWEHSVSKFAIDDEWQHAGKVYTASEKDISAYTDDIKGDIIAFHDGLTKEWLDTIHGLPVLEPDTRLQVIGNYDEGLIYLIHQSRGRYHAMYEYNLKNARIRPIYWPDEFDTHKERIGQSNPDVFYFDSTFYLSFRYRYPNRDEDTVWRVPHKGVFRLIGDSLHWVRSFGRDPCQNPEQTIWAHLQFTYNPMKGMIVVSSYWNDSVRVYDMEGRHIRNIRLSDSSYSYRPFLTEEKNVCEPGSSWPEYVRDHLTTFGDAGYLEDMNLWYRNVNLPVRSGRHGLYVMFYNDDGEHVASKGIDPKSVSTSTRFGSSYFHHIVARKENNDSIYFERHYYKLSISHPDELK